MRMLMFSIYDMKAMVYLVPFPARSDVDAKRQIAASFDNPQMKETPIAKHPEDFRLMRLGTFDDESGIMTCEQPQHVADIVALATPGTVPS